MAGFFNKLKAGTGNSAANGASPSKKKEEPAPELTPLEKMLQTAGPIRPDGSDKFFGLENFGNTCYCNSIVQALYYSETFRENVVNYPPHSPSETPNQNGTVPRVKVNIRPPMPVDPNVKKPTSAQLALKQRQAINSGQIGPGQQIKPEDRPDAPEYKKKQAMIKGPVLDLAPDNGTWGMKESPFTGLKDIFVALIESGARTGILSPQKFLDIFKEHNEMFRNQQHQDAHEFYGLLLNDVISNVEANARRMQEQENAKRKDGLEQSVHEALANSADVGHMLSGTRSPGTGWVHDIFEGLLTSETRCLTCETASQRDETFLDLSIDLEEHSSVTSCLRKFSAEEMLCERNKFHCDHCGGLQEAEKRMKIKRLPKVMALHLKRFKYTEDFTRLEKLFHRVVYPYHLRMFNTTDDAADPDRLYELYAVVVHIGGNAYHGHYVSIIKTQDRGWLLFDDEMVEPVDKHFVMNFFGDKPGTACAYVLFYQETTFEKVRAEQEAEGLEEVKLASQKAELALGTLQPNGTTNGLTRQITQPMSPVDDQEDMARLGHAVTAPGTIPVPDPGAPPLPAPGTYNQPLAPAPPPAPAVVEKSKEDRERDKKEAKAAEKARKVAEKEQAKLEEKQRKEKDDRARELRRAETEELRRVMEASKQTAADEEKGRKKDSSEGSPLLAKAGGGGFLNRANRGSKSMSKKSFPFLSKDRRDSTDVGVVEGPNGTGNGHVASAGGEAKPEKHALKERFSFGLGRKKSFAQ